MKNLLGIKNINSHSELDSESINLMDNKELALIDSGSESGMTRGKCVIPLSLRERVRVRGQLLTLSDNEIAEPVRNDKGKCIITPPEFLGSQSSLRNSALPVQGGRMRAGFTLAGATHVGLPPIIAKAGFTLAEVLITLGIIGVVAAMTIPNLISNIYGIRYKSQLKKSISTLAQAGKLNKANYDWSYADVSEQCSGTDFMKHTSDSKTSICAILNSNLSGIQGVYRNQELTQRYQYNMKTYTANFSGVAGQFTVYMLKDGTLVGVRSISTSKGCELKIGNRLGEALSNPDTSNGLWTCTGFIDVNGVTLPNEETRCSDGTTNKDVDVSCVVKNKDIKDVYPIVFYNDTVSPATNAGRYVFQSAK